MNVVVGEVEAEKGFEGGYLRLDLAGEVVAGEVEQLDVGAVGEERRNGAVQAIVVEVKEA